MTSTPPDPFPAAQTLPRMPAWVTAGAAQAPEEAAFSSGAALAVLQAALSCDAVPRALLRERLALRAAEACVVVSGRPERTGDLRDAALARALGRDHLMPLLAAGMYAPLHKLFFEVLGYLSKDVDIDIAGARGLPDPQSQHLTLSLWPKCPG